MKEVKDDFYLFASASQCFLPWETLVKRILHYMGPLKHCVDVCCCALPSASLYQRVSLCLCVSSILLGLGQRQPNASTHYITSRAHTQIHTEGLIEPPQLPALSSASSAAGCLSGEVISHNPWDSTCASMCVVIVFSLCEVTDVYVSAFCCVTNASLVRNGFHIVPEFLRLLLWECVCVHVRVCVCE